MRRLVKILSLLAVFIVGNYSAAISQTSENDGLALLGNVQSIKTTEKPDRVIYEVQLRLLFRNDGNKTLILLNTSLFEFYATRKVEYLYRSLGTETRPPDEAESVVAAKTIPPAWISERVDGASINQIFYGLASRLDKSQPPFQQTITLEPGVNHEFLDKITIEQFFRLDKESRRAVKRWEAFDAGDAYEPSIPVSELPAFTIEYKISFGKRPGLLEALQHRWRPYGRLVMDAKGDFTVKSERILNLSGK